MLHEIQFLSFNERDQVYGWIYVPACEPEGIIQLIHGFGEHSRRYLHMITSFMEAGYIVVADDANIKNNVYGGGEYCYTTNSTNIYVLGGIVQGSVHGGANRNSTAIPTANIYVNGGKVVGSVYGGSNNSGTVETSSVSPAGCHLPLKGKASFAKTIPQTIFFLMVRMFFPSFRS